jgi:putative inorganic carbon (HCO3(-)) transporter
MASENQPESKGLPPLRIRSIWTGYWAQPWSFKFTCFYVFFEYVRPQQIYPVLQIIPWALLSIGLALTAFLLEGARVRSRTMVNGWLFAFSVVIVLSSILAEYPEVSLERLPTQVNWLLAFFLIANTATDRRKFFLFIVLFMLWSTKMSQHGMRAFVGGGGQASGAPGWFQNTGEFALQMSIFVPLSLQFVIGLYPTLPKRTVALLALLPISGVLSIIGSGSRGGLLALAGVGLWMLLVSKRKLRGFVAIAVSAPLVWIAIPDYQKDRLSTAGSDKTSVSRLTYWKAGVEMANAHPLLGVGYENWVPYYRDHYSSTEGRIIRYGDRGQVIVEVAHNSFVEVMSQLGYTGLLLFLSLLCCIWVLNARTRRLLSALGTQERFLRHISYGLDAGVMGFIVAGFFMSVAFYPFVWFQLGMSAALYATAQQAAQQAAQLTAEGNRGPLPVARGQLRSAWRAQRAAYNRR